MENKLNKVTVKRLIDLLHKQDPDAFIEICVSGYTTKFEELDMIDSKNDYQVVNGSPHYNDKYKGVRLWVRLPEYGDDTYLTFQRRKK